MFTKKQLDSIFVMSLYYHHESKRFILIDAKLNDIDLTNEEKKSINLNNQSWLKSQYHLMLRISCCGTLDNEAFDELETLIGVVPDEHITSFIDEIYLDRKGPRISVDTLFAGLSGLFKTEYVLKGV
jgi:hypothetical protein